VKRTQLYLDAGVWKRLHILARQSGTTVSDLVRQAIREKYTGGPATRREALQSIAGLWKDRTDITDSTAYVRALRKDNRLEKITR
jgi:macrodomain Ter protein organizer (MatP/YcbG family)